MKIEVAHCYVTNACLLLWCFFLICYTFLFHTEREAFCCRLVSWHHIIRQKMQLALMRYMSVVVWIYLTDLRPVWGRGTPLPPCPFTSSSFPLFTFFLSFIGFTYFLLLFIPSLSTRIVPLRFQAGGCRRRPNLGLVSFFMFFCVCNLCYLYSLVKMHCGVFWFTLCILSVLWHCWLGHLTRKNLSPYDL